MGGGIAAGVLIVGGILSSMFGGGDSTSTSTSSTPSNDAAAQLSDAAASVSSAIDAATSGGQDSASNASSKDSDLAVGETFTGRKGLAITVNSFNSITDVFGDPNVCAEVNYTNNGTDQADFQGYWDWKVQNPNGVITDPTFVASANMLESGSLAPGGTITGDVCFKGADPGEYTLNYDPQLQIFSDKASWKATI